MNDRKKAVHVGTVVLETVKNHLWLSFAILAVVAGAVGASSALCEVSVWSQFMPLTIRKMTKAMMIKLIIAVKNAPTRNAAPPSTNS